MNLAYQSLLMLVLLVSGSVAVLPLALRESAPMASPSPSRRPEVGASALWLVETPKGRWLVNGASLPPGDLEGLLQRRAHQQRVHYLPSDALPFLRVSQSLRWLRQRTPGAVTLELPPGGQPPTP